MNNYATMTADFDRQKYAQAALYTGVIASALLLLIWFVKFYEPVVPPPPVEEYVEIALPDIPEANLGSSNVGSGDDQPEIPGDPAPAAQSSSTPVQSTEPVADISRDIEESSDHNDPPVVKTNVAKPDAKNVNTEPKAVKNNVTTTTLPAPPAPKPKAVAGRTLGGNGNGGNGAESYKPGTGEGPGDGVGDKGVVGGNPNGTNYSGGPRVTRGDRRIVKHYAFRDDLKPAKISAEILVSAEGKGSFVRIVRGIQTQDYKSAIARYLQNITFDKSNKESKVVVEFIFDQD